MTLDVFCVRVRVTRGGMGVPSASSPFRLRRRRSAFCESVSAFFSRSTSDSTPLCTL